MRAYAGNFSFSVCFALTGRATDFSRVILKEGFFWARWNTLVSVEIFVSSYLCTSACAYFVVCVAVLNVEILYTGFAFRFTIFATIYL